MAYYIFLLKILSHYIKKYTKKQSCEKTCFFVNVFTRKQKAGQTDPLLNFRAGLLVSPSRNCFFNPENNPGGNHRPKRGHNRRRRRFFRFAVEYLASPADKL